MIKVRVFQYILIIISINFSCNNQNVDLLYQLKNIDQKSVTDEILKNLKNKRIEFEEIGIDSIFQNDIRNKIDFYSNPENSKNYRTNLLSLLKDQKLKDKGLERVVVWNIVSSGEMITTETYIFLESKETCRYIYKFDNDNKVIKDKCLDKDLDILITNFKNRENLSNLNYIGPNDYCLLYIFDKNETFVNLYYLSASDPILFE